MTGRTIDELRLGDAAALTRKVESHDIESFVTAVGDYNPLHSDPVYAATTMFKTPIVPGVLTAGMISAVIGTKLPGPGSVYVSQDLRFLKPVWIGDTITARAEVLELIPERNRVRLKTVCTNQRGEDVLMGEAWVLPSKRPIVYEPRPRSPLELSRRAWDSWFAAGRAAATLSLLGARALLDLSHSTRGRSGQPPSASV